MSPYFKNLTAKKRAKWLNITFFVALSQHWLLLLCPLTSHCGSNLNLNTGQELEALQASHVGCGK
jgi:predicted membrane channel-forming protein YqfA (hemolysin III family)